MIVNPFLRQVEVTIGPYEDYSTKDQNDQLALVFRGDGTPDFFRIKFSIHKHKITTATPTVVQLYNLSEETRSLISRSGQKRIVIKTGWVNTKMFQLFQGTINASVTKRQGADLVTDIML